MPEVVVANLTNETIEKYEIDYKEYGRGLAIHLLQEHTPVKCSRLGEENVFIVAPGLLAGAPVPCATRATIVARDDETSGVSVSNITGDMPQKLASLQVAALVIKGKSEIGDVVLYLDKDKTELYHMPELRGKVCGDVVDILRTKWGDDSAIIGCGPAADKYLPISTLFVTYPKGEPQFNCPRSSFGDVPASKGLRAIILKHNKYFEAKCADRDLLHCEGKKLARYIINDPICGGALPGLGSITLLHLLKNKEATPEALIQKIDKSMKKEDMVKGRTNYCCAPMCVIGCLNRHCGSSGQIYKAPDESEVRAAVKGCFEQYFTEAEMDTCASLLAYKGMQIGINITETVFTIALYMEALGERPSVARIDELMDELKYGTVIGRILGGGTASVCRIFADNEKIQKKVTKPAVHKEKEYQLKMDRTVDRSAQKLSDLELLYQEIFLFENLGICIFTSFALLNKAETLQILTNLYTYKTGRPITVGELLEYSAKCLHREEKLFSHSKGEVAVRRIPEFVKVLYRYFEDSEK